MQEAQVQEAQIEGSVGSQQDAPKKVENSSKQKSVGLWDDHEHQKYIIFIDFFKRELNSKRYRRNNRVYKSMADFIQTRTPIQCRSHHTKLMRTFRNILNIIKDFKKEIGNQEYSEAKKLLTSDHKIFKNKQTPCRIARTPHSAQRHASTKSVGVQTDFTLPPNATILESESAGLAPNFSYMQCAGPFFWLIQQ